MLEWILEYVNSFNSYAKEYPMIAGALSLWALGVLTYIAKVWPKKVWEMLQKQCTTSISILNSSQSYYDFMKWFEENNYSKKLRNLKINNGMYGYQETTKSIGYGIHYVWMGFRLVKVELKMLESDSVREKDQLFLTVVGRSQSFFDKIFKKIADKNDEYLNKTKLYEYTGKEWEWCNPQVQRRFDTVYLEDKTEKKIKNHIETFINKEQWHLDKGVPYQTGILLYGPPGTGKTSVIRAIAAEFNKPLYVLPTTVLSTISSAFEQLPDNAIVIIEDIDCSSSSHKRSIADEEDETTSVFSRMSKSSISDILNTLSGVRTTHGRILIATTNHIEKLDPAILRPGRFDLKIEIGYASNEVFRKMFTNFYDVDIPNNFEIKDNVTTSEIQKYILGHLEEPEMVIQKCNKKPTFMNIKKGKMKHDSNC